LHSITGADLVATAKIVGDTGARITRRAA